LFLWHSRIVWLLLIEVRHVTSMVSVLKLSYVDQIRKI
jgi:hypothetical protein